MESLPGLPGTVWGRVSSLHLSTCAPLLPASSVQAHSTGLGRTSPGLGALVGESKVLWLIEFSESQQFEQCFLFCSGQVMAPIL